MTSPCIRPCMVGSGDIGTLFARKDRDILIEQSGSGYSNRAVTAFREAV